MIVSTFKNLKSTNVEAQSDIQSIMDMIKNGRFKKQIGLIRSIGKKHPNYAKLKASIATITPAACFGLKRKLENMEGLSGMIYFDVDDNINPELLNQYPFIYSYWKSVSGVGFGVLVKVDHLTVNNFGNTWDYIAECFAANGIMVDPSTRNIAVQNVISYDPNLHVNSNCIPLDADLISAHKEEFSKNNKS